MVRSNGNSRPIGVGWIRGAFRDWRAVGGARGARAVRALPNFIKAGPGQFGQCPILLRGVCPGTWHAALACQIGVSATWPKLVKCALAKIVNLVWCWRRAPGRGCAGFFSMAAWINIGEPHAWCRGWCGGGWWKGGKGRNAPREITRAMELARN